MKVRTPRNLWIACSLAWVSLSSCTWLDDLAGPDPLRQTTANQPNMTAPVVPAEPPAPVVSSAPKPVSATSPSTAHLAAGLRSSQPENKLDISTPPPDKSKEASMPIQRVSAVRQSPWTGDHVSWEQARSQLEARGVNWMQLELHEGVWHLQCSIPDAQDPKKVRFFEADAKDEVSAMQAVLEKVGAGK